jgi:hypothetical protein
LEIDLADATPAAAKDGSDGFSLGASQILLGLLLIGGLLGLAAFQRIRGAD